MRLGGAIMLAALSLVPAPCAAQVTISGGLLWSGGYDIGSSTAELRSNVTGTAPLPFTWFEADSRIAPAAGFEARVGVDVTRSLTVEGGASYAAPRLSFTISQDAEAPGQTLAGESLHQYVFDGAITWRLPIPTPRRVTPVVVAGAGYLRQLHEERTQVESGQLYYAGGGARFWLRGSATSSRSAGPSSGCR